MVITRSDTGQIALPGGFLNKGKRPGQLENPYVAAIREGCEETDLNILQHTYTKRHIYSGPLADLRVTAHAWPHTHAFHFRLDPHSTEGMPVDFVKGGDDAAMKGWLPVSELDKMHGSHRLLVQLALGE